MSVGAPKRRRIVSAAPRPCWFHWDQSSVSPQEPIPALLVEWSQVETPIGPRWEGLIVYARGGGELGWRVEMRWVRAESLRPAG